MTTALRSNETTALSALGEALQVSARMSVFLAEELLPLMAGIWPASANQLDGNARGVALAWGSYSGASMLSRSGRRCCSLGKMPSGSLHRGRRRLGPPFCGIIPSPAPRQLAARCLCEYVSWRRR